MLNIGSLQLDFPVVQAALAGYSDAPMRLIARQHGAPYALQEVMLDKLIVQSGRVRARLLGRLDPRDHPIGGQLLGARPPEFAEAADVVGEVADYCAGLGLTMNLETGQETAGTLLHMLESLNRDNLGVNFDPANMIMYGSGEPLEALRKVGAHIKSCHCKDAVWSDTPGKEWGKEVPLGQGDVNIEQFVATLHELGYAGPLTIEREISGDQQLVDIKAAIELLNQVKAKLGIA